MLAIEGTVYTPVLRLKQGEYWALAALTEQVKSFVLPHLVIPPGTENDLEKRRPLTTEELILESASRIARFWPIRTCLVDARFLTQSLGAADAPLWLEELFSCIQRKGGRPVPVAHLAMLSEEVEGIRRVAKRLDSGLALRVTLDDLAGTNVSTRIHDFMVRIVKTPTDTILILDLSDAGFDDPVAVAGLIANSVQRMEATGRWSRIIVEASHFPMINPAPKNGVACVPRNEWVAWRNMREQNPELADLVSFGDFTADNSTFLWPSKKGGGKPIPHFRYALERTESWLIVRGGPETDTDDGTIACVARKIMQSGEFSGEDFSVGDEIIAMCAAGYVGNPSIWRKANVNHHITRVVADLARERHLVISRRVKRPKVEQMSLPGT